jgi:mono/diheme cytochrome c family protein
MTAAAAVIASTTHGLADNAWPAKILRGALRGRERLARSSATRVILVATLLLGGCGKGDEPGMAQTDIPPGPSTATATADPAAKAKEIFATRCVPCHGSVGQGDGPASASLNPKPRKYADTAWQASVTDEYIEKIIKFGGAAVGKSPAMPNNPDLNDPAVVSALKDIVRSFGKKK